MCGNHMLTPSRAAALEQALDDLFWMTYFPLFCPVRFPQVELKGLILQASCALPSHTPQMTQVCCAKKNNM